MKRNTSEINNLLVGSFNEGFRRFNEKSFVGVISVFNLIVELNVVPCNEVTDFLFNLVITLILVNSTREIRSLGSMSEDDILIVDFFTQSLLEGDNVISTRSFHDSIVIFVININTINVRILINKFS